jgi:hypothetical protein
VRDRCTWLLMAACATAAGCRLIDAAGGAEPADAAGCSTVPQLTDDFEDGVTAVEWTRYADTGTAVEEADGVLRVLYSGAAEAWGGYVTAEPHDLRGGWLAAEVAQVGGETIIELNDGDSKVQTYADGTTIFCTVMIDGETVSEFQTEYLPDSHVHWRMREEDGSIHWETSPEGDHWSQLVAYPTPIAADAVTLLLSGGGVDGDQPTEFESVDIAAADCAQSFR